MNGTRVASPWGSLLAGLILAMGLIQPVQAVVVSTTTGNDSAPADDFGYAHVGKAIASEPKNNASAVYLGYGWVLGAKHVGALPLELNGVEYPVSTSFPTVRLLNPTGMGWSTYTDLLLYHLDLSDGSPRLAPLAISATSPPLGQELTMVGWGGDRDDRLYAWDVSGTYPEGTDWTWTETDPPGDERGFKIFSSRSLRWGTNAISSFVTVNVGTTSVPIHIRAMKTYFEEGEDATEFEAQGVAGDSGGGAFYKRGTAWELAGIINAVSRYPNEPTPAIFGLATYMADLSVYRDQIVTATAPTPGDANLDGEVDDRDAAILAAHWQMPLHAIWEDGDFTGDGRVNDEDAAVMAANWHASAVGAGGGGTETASGNVPEPSTLALLAGAAMVLFLRRALRRS